MLFSAAYFYGSNLVWLTVKTISLVDQGIDDSFSGRTVFSRCCSRSSAKWILLFSWTKIRKRQGYEFALNDRKLYTKDQSIPRFLRHEVSEIDVVNVSRFCRVSCSEREHAMSSWLEKKYDEMMEKSQRRANSRKPWKHVAEHCIFQFPLFASLSLLRLLLFTPISSGIRLILSLWCTLSVSHIPACTILQSCSFIIIPFTKPPSGSPLYFLVLFLCPCSCMVLFLNISWKTMVSYYISYDMKTDYALRFSYPSCCLLFSSTFFFLLSLNWLSFLLSLLSNPAAFYACSFLMLIFLFTLVFIIFFSPFLLLLHCCIVDFLYI